MKETQEGKGKWMIMPAKAGTCPICAVDHAKHLPHNQESLFYQTRFYLENNRYPTWTDAMAECSDTIKELWTAALKKAGVKFD